MSKNKYKYWTLQEQHRDGSSPLRMYVGNLHKLPEKGEFTQWDGNWQKRDGYQTEEEAHEYMKANFPEMTFIEHKELNVRW